MKIRPRYGTPPVLSYAGDPAAVAAPMVRQRLRLGQALGRFGPAQWQAPSRCAQWTNRDVAAHLVSTNRFWIHSISQARRGIATEMLAAFDPVATPASLVSAAGHGDPAETLKAYLESTHTLVDLVGSLTASEWTLPGESPVGHVSVSAVVRHALWDAWVHERDILLGVGLVPPAEADEVDAALRCAAALGPVYGILLGDLGDQPRAATVTTRDPALGFTVKASRSVHITTDPEPLPGTLHGRAVDLLDGLSLRGPLHLEPELRWLTAGLTRTFETRSAGDPRSPGC